MLQIFLVIHLSNQQQLDKFKIQFLLQLIILMSIVIMEMTVELQFTLIMRQPLLLFEWVLNTKPVDSVFNNLSAGFYIVSVIDDNNCLHRDTVAILAPSNPLQAIVSSKVNTCHSDSSAFAVAGIAVPFANGTYLYNWYDSNVGSTNPTISTNDTAFNLYTGTYFVRITDANGCDTNASVQIISPQLPLSSSNRLVLLCVRGIVVVTLLVMQVEVFHRIHILGLLLGGIIQQTFLV